MSLESMQCHPVPRALDEQKTFYHFYQLLIKSICFLNLLISMQVAVSLLVQERTGTPDHRQCNNVTKKEESTKPNQAFHPSRAK